ncbi:hypothetical protein D1BOALGB6SA_8524 [Olavius sp. associated proteobacterium Delta 1]|nr:hypothetical protein D1BOALGB6SA_8524 [Olavius sp. associated proteobacterium Delta 1]
MGKSDDIYWQRWQKLLEAAANFQELLTGSVMIGGSAAALHLKHRYSFDADHILSDLEENYEEVLDFLEGRDDWETARINPPKLILGNFQGVETGVRQLRRNRPLETEQIRISSKSLTTLTLPEMIRTKGWMIVSRNATRDYIDFAALAKHMGIENTVEVLIDFDDFYSDLIRGSQASPIVQLIRQLVEPKPGDLEQIDLSLYKGIQPPFDSWDYIVKICEEISVELGDRL